MLQNYWMIYRNYCTYNRNCFKRTLITLFHEIILFTSEFSSATFFYVSIVSATLFNSHLYHCLYLYLFLSLSYFTLLKWLDLFQNYIGFRFYAWYFVSLTIFRCLFLYLSFFLYFFHYFGYFLQYQCNYFLVDCNWTSWDLTQYDGFKKVVSNCNRCKSSYLNTMTLFRSYSKWAGMKTSFLG